MVLVCLARDRLSAENVTLLLVVAFLVASLVAHALWPPRAPIGGPRFVASCAARALVVELCHMPSRPLYPSLTFRAGDAAGTLAWKAGVDLALTLPAYVAIFALVLALLRRYRYGVAAYALAFSLGQALGDGGALFFAAHPALLLFLPHALLKYQAMQLVPFLSARANLGARSPGALGLAAPLVLLPLAYAVLGAGLMLFGRRAGLT